MPTPVMARLKMNARLRPMFSRYLPTIGAVILELRAKLPSISPISETGTPSFFACIGKKGDGIENIEL